MFTGLIEEVGYLVERRGERYRINASKVLDDAEIGDSIAVNGSCLTVVARSQDWWETDVSAETEQRTTIGSLKFGDPVNLERAVRVSDRLGGHVTQGHVDAVGEVLAPAPDLEVRIPEELMAYCVEKGSIAVDGVSLTIFRLTDDSFTVAVIPHTAAVTTLGGKSRGDSVNIEVDIVGKYFEKLLSPYFARLAAAMTTVEKPELIAEEPGVAPDVVVRNLSKCFFHNDLLVEALRNVNLDIAGGEFVSVIGPSGCGKSTLLRLIGGLMDADGGEIRVGSRTPQQMREQKAFGFVPQTPSLLPWLTVMHNVTLLRDTGRWHGRGAAQVKTSRDPGLLLEEVGLSAFANSYPKTLSGGMQQRVSLVRAFALGAPILLMDEPFAALDEITRNAMRYQLLDIWGATRTTVIFVTHSIHEAVMLSDRVITMAARPGRVAASETIDLPRPRTEEMEFTPEFTELAHSVRRSLREGWGK